MNPMTRWNPFRQMSRFEVPEFEDLFRGFGLKPLSREVDIALDMRLDLKEDDRAYRVTVEMPGVKKEDIDVSVEGNQIRISAEVRREKSTEKEKEIYSERYVGKAFRSFLLPTEVESAKADAHYDGGILTLVLPKKSEGSTKRLPIH